MAKLNDAARKHLGIIHHRNVVEVIEQIKVVRDQLEQIDEFADISKDEMNSLVALLEKYSDILNAIKL